MARGRKKQEIEEGYIKERFIVDLILNEEELAKINEIGKTKYISDLVKKDFNASKIDEDSYNLIVTDEIREKFNNDPRRAYLLGQLLTEFYCNIKTEATPLVNIKTEVKNTTDNNMKKENRFENEEIAVEEDVEIEEIITETSESKIDEMINVEKETQNEAVEKSSTVEEVAIELEKKEIRNANPSKGDGRVGRLNTAPLMKKTLGDKNR